MSSAPYPYPPNFHRLAGNNADKERAMGHKGLFTGKYLLSTSICQVKRNRDMKAKKRNVNTGPKLMAPHSSTLAWEIPWTEEPGRLQSMGSLRVGHGWATSLSLFTSMHWRRKWQPTLVFLPGESLVRGSLAGCRLWGHTESDMTEAT